MGQQKMNVAIIGGGVVGCSIARYLSQYDCRAVLFEKDEDVCSGTSKANSAIVHAGYDAEPGSKKALFNIQGNLMMDQVAKELDVPFNRIGSLVLCFHEEDREKLEILLERGKKNGIPNLRIIEQDELRKLEPNVSDDAKAALYAPTAGIICPFLLTIAMAENAADNGVEFLLNTKVLEVQKTETGFKLLTDGGTYYADNVINAAGIYADVFHNMVSKEKLKITPRKGEYHLYDREVGAMVRHTLFQLPDSMGKGVLVSPTVHGNLLMGPTAENTDDREDTATTMSGLEKVTKQAGKSIKTIPMRQLITGFAGLRAHEAGGDFVLGECDDTPGFFDAAGIESPGLSAAPAIGLWLSDQVAKRGGFARKDSFNPQRKGIIHPADLPFEERALLISKNPAYGEIICRCEQVSEGEIVDAINRTLGARSLDGIKRRVRAGMGRCQAGFCSPRVMEILASQTKRLLEEVCKNHSGSELLSKEERP